MNLCKCGCGIEIISKKNKSGYKRGHNPNSTIFNAEWFDRILRNGPTKELIAKMKQTKNLNPHKPTKEENLKRGNTIRENHLKFGFTEKEKAKGCKISKSKMGHIVTDETKNKLREAGKFQWEKDYDRMIKAVFNARKPNKLEIDFDFFLQNNFPGEWKYVGDGQVWIGGKCPDYININGKKQLIELFGNYWHKPEDEEIRKSHFKKFGYETIVVWESESKDKENLLIRLSN